MTVAAADDLTLVIPAVNRRMAGERGLDIVELTEQGGWRSLQVLRKYYRPDPRRIAAKLDARPE